MQVYLDNAQATPALSVVDGKGIIKLKVYFCEDGILINNKPLESFPERDGLLLVGKEQRLPIARNN